MEDRKYYVYEWYIVETGEIFYVGQGCGGRFRNITKRSVYFKEIYNNNNCQSRKIHINLTQEEAFKLEEETISKYTSLGYKLVNRTTGGKHYKASKETRQKQSKQRKGKRCKEENPFYGKHHTDECKHRMSEAKKDKYTDEKNPNAKKISLYIDGTYVESFDCIKQCALYILDDLGIGTNDSDEVRRTSAKIGWYAKRNKLFRDKYTFKFI